LSLSSSLVETKPGIDSSELLPVAAASEGRDELLARTADLDGIGFRSIFQLNYFLFRKLHHRAFNAASVAEKTRMDAI
jgi:hypothetical protein